MHIAILVNHDFDSLADDPAHAARADVFNVAHALARALEDAGHTAKLVPLGRSPLATLERLCDAPPDAAINLCESLHGDARAEAIVPLTLDLHGVPYTGSGGLGLSLALHKPKAKELLRARGVPTPDWAVLEDAQAAAACTLPFPLIVKPAREDASAGIEASSVVRDQAGLVDAVGKVVARFHQPALVERYIAGRELNVALLGPALQPLPLAEIDFSKLPSHLPPIVTYAGKWDEESVECTHTPSRASDLSGPLAERVVEVARAAFAALECRDYGRVDVRLAEDGTPYVIDVNPNCDLSPTSGFAKAASRGGYSYAELACELVAIARKRHGIATAAPSRSTAPLGDARPDLAVHAGGSGLRTRAG